MHPPFLLPPSALPPTERDGKQVYTHTRGQTLSFSSTQLIRNSVFKWCMLSMYMGWLRSVGSIKL